MCNPGDTYGWTGTCSGITPTYFPDGDGSPYHVGGGMAQWSFSGVTQDAGSEIWLIYTNDVATDCPSCRNVPWFNQGAGVYGLYDHFPGGTGNWLTWNGDSEGGFPNTGNYPWLYLATTPDPPSPPIPFFVTPQNGTTTGDFRQWIVQASNLSTTSTYRMDVFYSQPGTSQTFDDFNLAQPGTPAAQFIVPKTVALYDPTQPTSTWNAYAYLSLCTDLSACTDPVFTGTPIQSSTLITFYIGAATTPTTTLPSANCQFTTSSFISDPVGVIENGVCTALGYLFLPNPAQQKDLGNRFAGSGSIIARKPPIGYFTLAYNNLVGLSLASGTSPFMSTSTYAAFNNLLYPLKIGLDALLGLLFLFWVIRKISRMQF